MTCFFQSELFMGPGPRRPPPHPAARSSRRCEDRPSLCVEDAAPLRSPLEPVQACQGSRAAGHAGLTASVIPGGRHGGPPPARLPSTRGGPITWGQWAHVGVATPPRVGGGGRAGAGDRPGPPVGVSSLS